MTVTAGSFDEQGATPSPTHRPAVRLRVLEGDVVETGALTLPQILRMFFDAHGELVPRRQEPAEGLAAELVEELRAADEIAASAFSANTRRAYGSHARKWLEWAAERQLPLLPASPHDVRTHLTAYAVLIGEDGLPVRDSQGRLVSRISSVSVEQRLAAIDALHRLADAPPPGADDSVRSFMRGMRSTFGRPPQRARAAIDMARLRKVLAVLEGDSLPQLRSTVIAHLAVRFAATAGQLARLDWLDVQIHENAVVIELPRDRAGAPRRVVTARLHRRAELCTVRVLRRLHELTGPTGPVLAHPDGTGLTRQGIHKAIAQLGEMPPARTPTKADVALSALGRASSGTGQLRRRRDTALVLVGWFAALRRSSIVSLDWDHLTPQGPQGWAMLLAKSKNDQEGAGKILWLPRSPSGTKVPDPAAALDAWHAAVTAVLGFDPRTIKGIPVFPPIDRRDKIVRRGEHPQRMSGAAVNELVQDLARRAGLDVGDQLSASGMPIDRDMNAFGAHSLRVGFITESLTDNKLTVAEVMSVSTHRSASVMLGYYRAANSSKHNATRKLLGLLE